MIGTPKPEQSNTMDYSDSLPHLPTPSSFTKLSQLIDPPRCSWVIDDGLIESVNHPKPVSLWEWMSGIEKICTDLSNSDQSATCATSKDLIDIVVNNDDDEGKTAFHSSVDGDDRMVENADEAREDEEDVGSNNNNRPSKKSRGPLASIQDEEGLSKVDRRRSNRISAKPDTSNGGRTGAGTASALGLDGFKFEFDFPSSISTSTNTTHVFTGTTASASKAPSFGQKSKLDGFQFGFTMNPSTSSSDDDDNNNSSSNTNSPRRSEQKPSFDSLFNKITSLFDKNKVFTMAEQHLRLESKLITEKIHQVLKQTLVITPHNDHVYELDTLDHSLSALSDFNKKTTTGTTEGKPDKEVEEGGSSSSKAAAVGGSGVSNKSSFKTYSEYFQSHGYQISHPGTPLVSARLSKRVFNLTLPKELSMKSVKESKNAASSTAIANSNHDLVHLIPDCCQVLPFPVELARIAATLPSVLFRMDQYALTDELRQKLELPVVRNETLLSALTSSNALEPYSYERFEFLGDSFLKYSVTTDLYRSLPDTLSEGDLTRKRNELVRNQNLYRIAIQNCLQSFVFLNSLHHKSWMPSWLSRVDCKREVNSAGKLKDRYVGQKLLADIVEALVGAAYMDGGNDVALSLVAKFGLISSKCVVQSKMIDIHRLDSQSQKNEGKEHGGSKWKKKVSSAQQKILVAVEEILDYEYANKENLLEALTHPSMINNYLPTPAPTAAAATAPPPPPPQSSFSSSSYTVAVRRVTRSSASRNTSAAVQNRSPSLLSSVGVISVRRNYQRLEFLGDAIIDWAVARYLFNTFKSASPAILTELRQVAVCNDTFARICVNLGLESYIQHRSSALSNEVSRFSKSALSSASISSIATTTTSSSSSYNVAQAAPKTLGDVIESLAGSVYVDSAFSIVKFWQVFKPILSQMLESYINPTNSYKGYVRMFVEGLQKLGINSAEDIQYS